MRSGAIPTSPGKAAGKTGEHALHPLRARPGGKGSESEAEGWEEGGSGYGAGFRDQGQSPSLWRRRARDGREPQGSPTRVLRGVRNRQQAQRSWIRADRDWGVGEA